MIRTPSSIEPLEARIAPAALTVVNPLPDVVAGAGKTGALVELTEMFDPSVAHPNHTVLTFTVNLDSDPFTAGIQPSTFVMELFDDEAPLTVQNFLSYVQNPNTAPEFIDTFFHRSVSNFVVQGGGFNVTNPTKHIAVGPEVHNEFSPTRSNLTGTVAMAKTGNGPDTATSEWFVNLADNSANLDAQNGGFTVFGQIISGLDVFTKINALPTINQGGALTNLPVQNYNSDPDHNPNTPAPKPTANQLIRITDVHVEAPAAGNATGYTFSIGANTNPALFTNASVVTSNGHAQLKLDYAPGQSGEANVTVHVTNGTDTVDEVVHVKVLPNLIADVATDPLPNIIVPGDLGTAVLKLTNNGSGNFTSTTAGHLTTTVDIKFYLSKRTDTDTTGTVVDDPGDIVVGFLPGQVVNLAGGASTTFSVPIAVPSSLIAVESKGYHLIAKVTPAADSTAELFTDDNTAVDGKVHGFVNQVGHVSVFDSDTNTNFGTRIIPKLTFTEHDGSQVVVSITGPGTVDVIPDGNEFDLSVTSTSILSSVTIRAKTGANPARAELHNIDVTDAIGTLNLAGADIDGYTTISGGVQTLSMGNLTGDHTFILGALLPANSTRATISLGQVTDYNFESDQPIGLFTAVSWHDTTGDDDHIIAPVIDRLNIKGAPAAGATPKVAGDFEANVILEARAKMSLFRVAGFFENATFTGLKTSSVDVVSLGGMQHASFFVGTDARPAELGDFAKLRSIGTFTVTGAAAAGDVFIDSQVAAANIGAINIVRIDTASGSGDFGFVADKIASYVRDGRAPLLNLTKGQFDHVENYSVIALPFTP